MNITQTTIPGVLVLKPRRFVDARGFFIETFNDRAFRDSGIPVNFVQDNQSFSSRRGTIRGLHFQLPPSPQAKLVRVLRGSIYDVVVDLRLRSPTYGQWIAKILTADSDEQLFVPRGLAHGFCTLEDDTEVAYKVDGYYAPACDSGLIWDDPTLGISWPVTPADAVLSDKDRRLGRYSDFVSPFAYNGI
jgi:dTDP-4-dehydrorhamnose 3,5-epimerase